MVGGRPTSFMFSSAWTNPSKMFFSITSSAEALEFRIGFKTFASPSKPRKNVFKRAGLPRVWLAYVGTQSADCSSTPSTIRGKAISSHFTRICRRDYAPRQ